MKKSSNLLNNRALLICKYVIWLLVLPNFNTIVFRIQRMLKKYNFLLITTHIRAFILKMAMSWFVIFWTPGMASVTWDQKEDCRVFITWFMVMDRLVDNSQILRNTRKCLSLYVIKSGHLNQPGIEFFFIFWIYVSNEE